MDLQKTGAFIAQTRKSKGLTQKELAKLIGITDKAVSRWETGAGFPEVSCLEPLADTLGVSVLELLRGEPCQANTISTSTADVSMREALQVLNLGIRKKLWWLRIACRVMAVVIVLLLVTTYILGFISMRSDESLLMEQKGVTGTILYMHSVAPEANFYVLYDKNAQMLRFSFVNSHHLFGLDFLAKYKQMLYASSFSIAEWRLEEPFAYNERVEDRLYRVEWPVWQIAEGVTYSDYLVAGVAKNADVLYGLEPLFIQEIDGATVFCVLLDRDTLYELFYN